MMGTLEHDEESATKAAVRSPATNANEPLITSNGRALGNKRFEASPNRISFHPDPWRQVRNVSLATPERYVRNGGNESYCSRDHGVEVARSIFWATSFFFSSSSS